MYRLLRDAYGADSSFAPRLERCLEATRVQTFVAKIAGKPAGFVHGSDYAVAGYVAMMGVAPHAQGRGVGSALMDALLRWADSRGFARIELDATPSGARIYERFGFVDDGETAVFEGLARPAAAAAPARSATATDLACILRADGIAFDADRSEAIAALVADPANETFTCGERGFVVAQRGAIGPLVASDAEAAASLLHAACEARAGVRVRACIVAANRRAAALALRCGFEEERRLRHMLRGVRTSGDRSRLWARINLGQG